MGGIVDVNIHYSDYITFKYDVNSHYPYAMLSNPMPGGPPRISNETNLDNIFGFVEAIITCPQDIKTPLLLHNFNGKNIHPTGTWKGVYFSEELKAVVNHGYKVKMVNVYLFSREKNLFNDYVNHFHDLKKTATVNKDFTRRQISKLHLNTLYGMFGRKLEE